MKLWIDDLRPAPTGYDIIALNYHEAITLINQFSEELTHISFDGDLGPTSVDADGNELSGYDIATYIEELYVLGRIKLKSLITVQIHSSNYWQRNKIYGAFRYIAENHMNDITIHNIPYESFKGVDSYGFILTI